MPETLAPVDTTVSVPESVRRAAAAAEAAHKQAYQTPDPVVDPAAASVVDPATAAATAEPAAQPAPVAQPVAQPAPASEPAPAGDVDWEARYNSMKGRFDQSQRTIGSMQTQMSELGDELVRTQSLLTPRQQPQQQQPQRLLTDEDKATYGEDLINVVQRAAVEAVAPEINQLRQRNQQLERKVQQQDQNGIFAALDQAVPNWREINESDRFKAWCRLPDLYSGVLRGRLLNDAFRAGQSPRVAQFFRGFLAEEVATGQEPAPLPPAVERTAAVPLETLAAPGRAKPATGADNTNPPADKPIITRAQISAFYDQVRRGAYAGRDADKARDEAIIFAAQREGRTR